MNPWNFPIYLSTYHFRRWKSSPPDINKFAINFCGVQISLSQFIFLKFVLWYKSWFFFSFTMFLLVTGISRSQGFRCLLFCTLKKKKSKAFFFFFLSFFLGGMDGTHFHSTEGCIGQCNLKINIAGGREQICLGELAKTLTDDLD